MPEFIWDDDGNRFYLEADGTVTGAPELGSMETLAVSAGKQFTDIGRGLRSLAGQNVQQEAQEAQRYYAPVEQDSPFLTMAGETLPTLATAPIGAGGYLANLATQTALGAAEGYLDYDPRASAGQRAGAGALGGVLGDTAGRMAGRVLRGVKGFVDDVIGPRGRAVNPAAQAFEDLGGETLAFQRLEQGTRAADLAKRAAQGVEAGINPTGALRDVMGANDALFRRRAVEAVGLPDNYDNLGPQFFDDALERLNRGYTEVLEAATGGGPITVTEQTKDALLKTRNIKELKNDFGMFDGLDRNILDGSEYLEARRALTAEAAAAFSSSKPNPVKGDKLDQLVKRMDKEIAQGLPDDFLGEFNRLREQQRVFDILERPNVIDGTGQINVKTLNNTLKSKNLGFGRKAMRGAKTTNPESKALIDTMRAADNPEFKAFRTSGTAENLQLGRALDDAQAAVSGALGGDPRPALGFGAKLAAPGILSASQMGAGKTFEGAFTPARASMVRGGGFVGRSLLDEALYPFVGVDDERGQ